MVAELPMATRELDDRLAAALRRVEIEYRRKALGEQRSVLSQQLGYLPGEESDQLYQQYLDELIQGAKAQEGRVYPLNDDKWV